MNVVFGKTVVTLDKSDIIEALLRYIREEDVDIDNMDYSYIEDGIINALPISMTNMVITIEN